MPATQQISHYNTIQQISCRAFRQAVNQKRSLALDHASSSTKNSVHLGWHLNEPRESTECRSGLTEFHTAGTDTEKAHDVNVGRLTMTSVVRLDDGSREGSVSRDRVSSFVGKQCKFEVNSLPDGQPVHRMNDFSSIDRPSSINDSSSNYIMNTL